MTERSSFLSGTNVTGRPIGQTPLPHRPLTVPMTASVYDRGDGDGSGEGSAVPKGELRGHRKTELEILGSVDGDTVGQGRIVFMRKIVQIPIRRTTPPTVFVTVFVGLDGIDKN